MSKNSPRADRAITKAQLFAYSWRQEGKDSTRVYTFTENAIYYRDSIKSSTIKWISDTTYTTLRDFDHHHKAIKDVDTLMFYINDNHIHPWSLKKKKYIQESISTFYISNFYRYKKL